MRCSDVLGPLGVRDVRVGQREQARGNGHPNRRSHQYPQRDEPSGREHGQPDQGHRHPPHGAQAPLHVEEALAIDVVAA